ncbi:MAG: copper-binding protein [Acidobacteria bacterium]|nr:copper-binding protein [Acidobacteriota bacterium]
MTFSRHLTVCLILFLAFGCESQPDATKSSTANSASTPVPSASVIKNGDHPAKGTITKINTALGSVEMDHEEIAGIMPAMRMEFYVLDKGLLDRVSVGDRVDFTLRYKNGTETITAISRSK